MKKIMIVDDEPMMLKIADRALKDFYETIQASSGEEALSLYSSQSPDMIISDLKMPSMSGQELQEKITEMADSMVPFIFMTADEDFQSDTVDFIKKPVKADELLGLVNSIFEKTAKKIITHEELKRGVGDSKSEREKLPQWLVKSPLVNVHAGLNNSETADFMLSAIDIFLEHADSNLKEMEKFFGEGDYKNFTVKVHALKSTARIIGAMILSTMAGAMEKAGVEGDMEYLRSEYPILIDQYKKYIKLFSNNKKTESKKDISPEELEDALLAIKEAVSAEDFSLTEDALEYLEKCNLSPEKEKYIADIKENLYELDWEKVRSIVG